MLSSVELGCFGGTLRAVKRVVRLARNLELGADINQRFLQTRMDGSTIKQYSKMTIRKETCFLLIFPETLHNQITLAQELSLFFIQTVFYTMSYSLKFTADSRYLLLTWLKCGSNKAKCS